MALRSLEETKEDKVGRGGEEGHFFLLQTGEGKEGRKVGGRSAEGHLFCLEGERKDEEGGGGNGAFLTRSAALARSLMG